MTTRQIEKYLIKLQREEFEFKNQNSAVATNEPADQEKGLLRLVKVGWFIMRSLLDFTSLLLKLRLSSSFFEGKRFVFTARNLCTELDGKLEDRVVKPLFQDDIVFVSHSKEYYLHQINGFRVYNVGGVVKLLSLVSNRGQSRLMRIFLAYRAVNNAIVRLLRSNEVYTLCYYDLNGLSLAFSNHREKMKLCEVQHGSIINYPPYVKPSPIQIADVFYVKNQETVEYLKSHLCRDYDAEYKLIPYPKTQLKFVPGMHIFYASTVEFNGLHPVFKKFLAENEDGDLHVIVRLHPREQDKEELFRKQLSKYNINYEFDRSKNWIEGNTIKNLIVVSPWSSTIEDSCDNGFTTIVIDSVGKERYAHLIDGVQCFFSEDLGVSVDNSLETFVKV